MYIRLRWMSTRNVSISKIILDAPNAQRISFHNWCYCCFRSAVVCSLLPSYSRYCYCHSDNSAFFRYDLFCVPCLYISFTVSNINVHRRRASDLSRARKESSTHIFENKKSELNISLSQPDDAGIAFESDQQNEWVFKSANGGQLFSFSLHLDHSHTSVSIVCLQMYRSFTLSLSPSPFLSLSCSFSTIFHIIESYKRYSVEFCLCCFAKFVLFLLSMLLLLLLC